MAALPRETPGRRQEGDPVIGELQLRHRLEKYPAIKKSIEFSFNSLSALRAALTAALGSPNPREAPFIATAGSFARLEASPNSDLDFMIVYPSKSSVNKEAFRSRVADVISRVQLADESGAVSFAQPNPKGVFRSDVTADDIRDHIGTREEGYDNLARRLLLILESQGLWHEAFFLDVRASLLEGYAEGVLTDPSKHFVLLLNDLIRYFRTICVNYYAQMASEYGKWPIRNVKLRHSRVLMYSSLLLTLGELSKYEYASWLETEGGRINHKFATLQEFVRLPPLERLVRLYEINQDDNLFRLLGLYNFFLERLADRKTRGDLENLEYAERYGSTGFSSLKANSDAFAAEITRFLTARRGQWSDRFFEYIVL